MTMADELAYKILDADNHFNEPLSLYEQYIDPDKKDLAITVRKGHWKDVPLWPVSRRSSPCRLA
jgi:hypothetical protein